MTPDDLDQEIATTELRLSIARKREDQEAIQSLERLVKILRRSQLANAIGKKPKFPSVERRKHARKRA
jgi:hypothetical protein